MTIALYSGLVYLACAGLVVGMLALLSRPKTMRCQCSWCGVTLREGREPTSHGICDSCANEWFPLERSA